MSISHRSWLYKVDCLNAWTLCTLRLPHFVIIPYRLLVDSELDATMSAQWRRIRIGISIIYQGYRRRHIDGIWETRTRYTLPRTTEYKRRRCDGDVDQFVPKQIVDSARFALNVDVPQNVHSLFESMLSKAVKLKKAVHVHWLLRLSAS